jgi:branched-chain amino acid transport system ATP-binding protein
LSGGEQQMLAIGRAIMARPKLMILDEPSFGLAPLLVDAIFDKIRELNSAGFTILLVEQAVWKAFEVASRGYVLNLGKFIADGDIETLRRNPDVKAAYLSG